MRTILLIKLTVILLLIVSIASCKSVGLTDLPVPKEYGAKQYAWLTEDQKTDYLKTEKGYSYSEINAIIRREYFKGMTPEQIIYSIGKPTTTSNTYSSRGMSEQWIYHFGRESYYFNFVNSELENWHITKY